jgi:hypothetical protein
MRDKGSWIAKAHYSIRRSYPSIMMCLSVLGGDWTKGARNLLESTGETIVEIPMSRFVSVFAEEGVQLQWSETDRITPKNSWNAFQRLSERQKRKIGIDLLSAHKDAIVDFVKSTLTQDRSVIKIKKIELAIELENGRSIVYRFANEAEFDKFRKTFNSKEIK